MKVEEKITICRNWLGGKFKEWPRWAKIVSLIIIIAAGTVVWAAAREQDQPLPVKTAKVERQDVERAVFTNGSLEAENEHTFFSPVESTLMELNVKLGDRVQKGQVLGRLDTLELGRLYQQALSSLAGKEAELAAGLASDDEQQFKEAEAAYNMAKSHRDRTKTLYDAGAVSQEELETAEVEFQEKLTSYREARIKMEQRASSKQVKALQAQVDLCRQEVVQARERLDLATFIAPYDGVITSVGAKEGNRVQEGDELLVLAGDKALQAMARINEVDAGELQVGQSVGITCLALPGQKFEGEIIHIGGAAVQEESQDSTAGITKVPAKVRLKGDYHQLKLGYTVNLTIKIMEVKNVLTIPVEAVVEEKDSKKVWVLKDGLLEERAIETSRGNELKEIVLSGLQEGEEVVKNPVPELKNGQKAVMATEGTQA